MGVIFCDGWSIPISESAEEKADAKKREIEFLAKWYKPGGGCFIETLMQHGCQCGEFQKEMRWKNGNNN